MLRPIAKKNAVNFSEPSADCLPVDGAADSGARSKNVSSNGLGGIESLELCNLIQPQCC